MSVKTQSIGALFVALVIILAVNPKVVNNIYSSVLGRLFLISIVILLSMKNVTLGLLVALLKLLIYSFILFLPFQDFGIYFI